MLPNRIIENIIQNECGEWVWWPPGMGYHQAHNLRLLADHLDHLNAQINKDNYNASEQTTTETSEASG